MTTEYEQLNCRHHAGGVVEVQLGHAPQNALTTDVLMDLIGLVQELDSDDSCHAILFTSPFQDFCVGITEADACALDQDGQIALQSALNAAVLALYACETPMLCALRGRTLGEGMMFILASDIRIAHARAAVEISQVKQARGYPEALMALAQATMDSNTQRRLMLTGQRLGPIAARTAHLLEIIADDMEDLQDYAVKEAQKLAALPRDAFVAIKKELRATTIVSMKKQLEGAQHHRWSEPTDATENPLSKTA